MVLEQIDFFLKRKYSIILVAIRVVFFSVIVPSVTVGLRPGWLGSVTNTITLSLEKLRLSTDTDTPLTNVARASVEGFNKMNMILG